jgi:hypothetical protein
MIFALLSIAALHQDPILRDPTYKELSILVGGNWEAHPNPGLVIRQHYEFGVDGKVIRGMGTVSMKGKTLIYIHANFGWDPVAKRVTYVDFHNHDTIYMGYVTMKDGWLNYDFKEFSDPNKRYQAKSQFTDRDHYQFSLGPELIKMARK